MYIVADDTTGTILRYGVRVLLSIENRHSVCKDEDSDMKSAAIDFVTLHLRTPGTPSSGFSELQVLRTLGFLTVQSTTIT